MNNQNNIKSRLAKGAQQGLRLPMAGIILALLVGCAPLRLNEQRMADGLTIVLPGIDGRGLHNENICRTLAAKGVPTAVELYDWTAPGRGLLNQYDLERNRGIAATLAGRVQEYWRQYPGRPVYLVGLSGGTAIAVWTAEALPEGQEFDGVVLMGSSLSPGYDLTKALAHTRNVVTFHSSLDALVGGGCALIGTMDRKFTEGAGKVGFTVTYPKLIQVPYDPGMAKEGHDGSHLSYCATGFVAAHIAPLIKSRPFQTDAGGDWVARLSVFVQENLRRIYRDQILPGLTDISMSLRVRFRLSEEPVDNARTMFIRAQNTARESGDAARDRAISIEREARAAREEARIADMEALLPEDMERVDAMMAQGQAMVAKNQYLTAGLRHRHVAGGVCLSIRHGLLTVIPFDTYFRSPAHSSAAGLSGPTGQASNPPGQSLGG